MLAPYILIWVIIIAYLCHIPFAIRSQRWLASHPEVWDEKPRATARRAARDPPGAAEPPADTAAGAG